MPVECSLRVSLVKLCLDLRKRLLLCRRARVLSLFDVVLLRPPDIAYPYGVLVVANAVRPYHGLRASLVYAAVEVNQPVVADTVRPVPFIAVPVVNVLDGDMTAFRRGRTMSDDSVNASHFQFLFAC